MHSMTNFAILIGIVLGFCSCDQTNVGCDPDWYASDTQCYYIVTNKAVTRSQAEDDCGNRQANLLRYSDLNELKFIQNTIKGFKGDGFWTDLTDLRFDGTLTGTGIWMWGQYQTLDNSTIPWEGYPTAEPTESCGAMNVQGQFLNLQCTRRLGFICKIDLTPDVQGCPQDWLLTDNNACVKFSDTTNGTQLLTFTQAQQTCAGMAVPAGITKPAHLFTVASASDQTYLANQVQYLSQTTMEYWTGLKRSGQTWAWTTGENFDSTTITWATEPNHIAGNEHCGTIRTDGKFTDQDCTKNFNYICQKGTEIVDSTYYFGCGGWDRAGHKCYMFYDKPQVTWADALSRCNSIGSSLMKVENFDEKRWIEWQMSMVDIHRTIYWSGLNDQDQEGVYKWADKTLANASLIRWNAEPNDWLGNEDCAAIMKNGVYNDADCTLQTGFICEYINLAYKVNHQTGPICPQGWINLPNQLSCYYFSALNATYTWTEANDYCHKTAILSTTVPTTLLAVNSVIEKTFVEQQIAKLGAPYSGYWTSLTDKNQEGTWLYADSFNNPPNPQVLKWNGEPSDDGTMNQDCTFIMYGARYFDTNCNEKHGFVCERYADGLAAIYGAGSIVRVDIFKTVLLVIGAILVKNNI